MNYRLKKPLFEKNYEGPLTYGNRILNLPYIHKNIFRSNESRFTHLGIFNRKKKSYWLKENFHYQETRFQWSFGLKILENERIGPAIFDQALTRESYLQFHSNASVKF